VTPAVAIVSDDLPPGETARMWSPTSSILIHGQRDAILVDTLTTAARATVLAHWVEESGKNLTTIHTTHGHGDHFFGNGILLERFPGAKAVATPKAIETMRRQVSPQVMAALWNKRFPGLIPENIVLGEHLKGDILYLEGTRD
jgi:glyoxylase-like metal-dependent hydrolase (beta-lactamase superfamily II)